MRVGISGTHGTGKTTLAQALCARLPGHVAADEPYWLLEAEGYDFGFPPSAEDYRALLARSVRSLSSPTANGLARKPDAREQVLDHRLPGRMIL